MVESCDPKFLLRQLCERSIQDCHDYIRFAMEESKVLQRIREAYPDNWQIVEACREVLFDNAREIQCCYEQIELERAKIKELGNL